MPRELLPLLTLRSGRERGRTRTQARWTFWEERRAKTSRVRCSRQYVERTITETRGWGYDARGAHLVRGGSGGIATGAIFVGCRSETREFLDRVDDAVVAWNRLPLRRLARFRHDAPEVSACQQHLAHMLHRRHCAFNVGWVCGIRSPRTLHWW